MAPCRSVDNTVITYDENKATANMPTVLIIYRVIQEESALLWEMIV